MKQKLREELETLAQLEQVNGTDNLDPIVAIVTKYKHDWGSDPELDKFISDYLTERHERLYYESTRVKNG